MIFSNFISHSHSDLMTNILFIKYTTKFHSYLGSSLSTFNTIIIHFKHNQLWTADMHYITNMVATEFMLFIILITYHKYPVIVTDMSRENRSLYSNKFTCKIMKSIINLPFIRLIAM